MPGGLVLGVPTDPAALRGSPLVEAADVEQVRAELSRVGAPVTKDRSVGSLIRERFGDRIADRLVQPLLGGINAGVLDRLSLAAVAPQLDRVARAGPSLAAGLAEDLAASRQAAAVAGTVAPPFYGLPGGMGELIATLRAQLTNRGVTLRDGVRARSVRTAGGRLAIDVESTGSGEPREVTAGAVILAVPGAAAAALLRGGAARPTRLRRARCCCWTNCAPPRWPWCAWLCARIGSPPHLVVRACWCRTVPASSPWRSATHPPSGRT